MTIAGPSKPQRWLVVAQHGMSVYTEVVEASQRRLALIVALARFAGVGLKVRGTRIAARHVMGEVGRT